MKIVKRFKDYWLSDISFITQLLMLFAIVFILPIILEYNFESHTIFKILFLFLFFTGIFGADQPIFFYSAILFFTIQVVLYALELFFDVHHQAFELSSTIINVLLFIVINLKLLFRDNKVNIYRIIGAINVYLLFALLGALLINLIHILTGISLAGNITLNGTDQDFGHFLYYSMVSITTVGYGDVHAANVLVKMLSVLLSGLGILYPAVVVAKLVSSR